MRASRCPALFLLGLLPACGASGEDSATHSTTTAPTTGTTEQSTTGQSTTEQVTTEPTTSGQVTTGPGTSTGTTGDATTGSTGDATTASSTGEPPPANAWIASFGAPDDLHVGGLDFDAQGALWVAGDFFGALDLGAGPLAGEGTGLFLGKFASDGAPLHSQALFPAGGEATLTQVTGLAVDGAGAVIVTGWLEGAYEIGGETLSADELDLFVGKWSADGTPLWGQAFGAVDWQVAEALAVAADDSIWIAGATLAPFDVGAIALTGGAETGMFALRFAADGTPLVGSWWGAEGNQEIRSIAACPDGSAAIAGFFDAPLAFGDEVLAPASDKDLFVARIDAQAQALWIAAYGGGGTDYATDVACGDGVVFAGVVTGAAEFGALALAPEGDADTVVGRLELDGALSWAAGITGPADQLPTGVAALADGGAAVVLRTAGATTLGDAAYASAGGSDVLFARYPASAATPSQVVGLGDAGPQSAGPLALGPDGAAALAGTFSGAVTWPGLPPVAAAGPVDLVLVRFALDE